MRSFFIDFALFLAVTGTVAATSCSTTPIPNYVKLECRIASRESGQCFHYEEDGRRVNVCDDSAPCLAWTGAQLEISCGDEFVDTSLNLFRGNTTQGAHNVSWPFAVSSSVEGVYECREDSSDSLVANRSVIVDESVAVIPGSDFDNGQICRSIAPGYECKVAQIIHRYSVSHPQAPQTISLDFNVLGARPIDLSVEMVWSNHYPVDLDLSWNPVASNSTTLHSVELSTADLVFVGDTTFVDAYVAITANSSLQSYTMCLPVRFHGVADLFPEENLPNEVTVDAGQAANFKCQARIEDESSGGLPASSVTVAFLVRSPDSSELTQCLNCSFSMTELTMCREMVDEGSCSGLQFVKSSSNVLTQNLTAHWSEVDMRHSGYEVVCAIAVNGITQWAHTATLTVTPATYTPIIVAATPTFTSTTPSPSENPRESVNNRELVTGVTVGVVLLVIIVITVLCVLGLVVWYRNRHTKVGKIPLSSTDGSEEN